MNDRYAQTVGFVVAGVGLAATFLDWPADATLAMRAATGFAVFAAIAFAARRHGVDAPRLDALAGGGLAVAAAFGVAAASTGLPRGPALALLAGMGTVGAAVAAHAGLDADAVRARERRLVTGTVVSLAALVFGSLLASVAIGAVPDDPLVTTSVNTVVASVGYGLAGVAFVSWYDGAIDVSRPSRRDLTVAGVGVAAIFAVHYALVGLVVLFDLPQTSHTLVETARENPGILPPLVVLSYLAVGPSEELLARNGVQKYLYGAFSRRSAIVVGCLVFTAAHVLAYAGTGPGAVLVTLGRLFVVSLVLGVAYERTDDLFAPVFIHGTYDAVQFAMAYVAFTA
ncbi:MULTISPECIES: CPBP family intramembrane glutamic endopeptidase [Halobacterium]|uniref:CPBP family intramembrane glutamic endopeptidase n=1 Tax=Halobacterium TaxID=2239 RepID=UPI00073F982A|nr:type II CAAX endopeptidase family protein [Halobacterium sp. CBA1132]MCG1004093.1 CPBP family intramembrane metalloprotease [Halobacterium noricense]